MGLLGGKSVEEQFEDILATKYVKCAKQSAGEPIGAEAVMRHGDPFRFSGVIRSLRDLAFLDSEDKGY